ncbi:hypothetical protein WH8501_12710 [Crocosphaera watsonii WH 8501]|uniref:hypothetical protein n=1 Tax=Crocosphaera watsonii TaxID=263511 RepID=UPI0018DB8677|nr:hypothetical protein [Crocosphaera watsonii]
MASHESFCKNLVDYFRQAAVGSSHFLAVRREKPHTQFDPKKSECVILGKPQNYALKTDQLKWVWDGAFEVRKRLPHTAGKYFIFFIFWVRNLS